MALKSDLEKLEVHLKTKKIVLFTLLNSSKVETHLQFFKTIHADKENHFSSNNSKYGCES